MTSDAGKPTGALAAAQQAAEAAKEAAAAAVAAAKLAQDAVKGSPEGAVALAKSLDIAPPPPALLGDADAPVLSDTTSKLNKPLGPAAKLAKKLFKTLPPFTLESVGGSACLPPLALAVARFVLAAAQGVLAGGAAMRGAWGAVAPFALYAVLYALLAAASVARRLRAGRWAMWQHASILGAIYQTMASLALCAAPLAAVLFGRNFEVDPAKRRHSLIFLGYIVPACAFLIDCALGATPHFRNLFMVLPVVFGWIFVGIKFRSLRQRSVALYGSLFAWVVIAAFIAVVVSRMTGCWEKKEKGEPGGDHEGADDGQVVKDVKEQEMLSQV